MKGFGPTCEVASELQRSSEIEQRITVDSSTGVGEVYTSTLCIAGCMSFPDAGSPGCRVQSLDLASNSIEGDNFAHMRGRQGNPDPSYCGFLKMLQDGGQEHVSITPIYPLI